MPELDLPFKKFFDFFVYLEKIIILLMRGIMIEEKLNIGRQQKKLKLLTEIKQRMRVGGYSSKTIGAYTRWIKDYIVFNNKRHPANLGKENVENYLTHLAVKRNVSASTQNQALSAIL